MQCIFEGLIIQEEEQQQKKYRVNIIEGILKTSNAKNKNYIKNSKQNMFYSLLNCQHLANIHHMKSLFSVRGKYI